MTNPFPLFAAKTPSSGVAPRLHHTLRMTVTLSLDSSDGVWTLRQRAALLDSKSFAKWREQLLQELGGLVQPIDLLVDLAGLTLHPSFAPAFAIVLSRTRLIRQTFYYGADPGTAASLRLAFAYVRLYPDRETAWARMVDARDERMPVRRSGTIPSPSAVQHILRAAANERKPRR
jgi:hypothetical protein